VSRVSRDARASRARRRAASQARRDAEARRRPARGGTAGAPGRGGSDGAPARGGTAGAPGRRQRRPSCTWCGGRGTRRQRLRSRARRGTRWQPRVRRRCGRRGTRRRRGRRCRRGCDRTWRHRGRARTRRRDGTLRHRRRRGARRHRRCRTRRYRGRRRRGQFLLDLVREHLVFQCSDVFVLDIVIAFELVVLHLVRFELVFLDIRLETTVRELLDRQVRLGLDLLPDRLFFDRGFDLGLRRRRRGARRAGFEIGEPAREEVPARLGIGLVLGRLGLLAGARDDLAAHRAQRDGDGIDAAPLGLDLDALIRARVRGTRPPQPHVQVLTREQRERAPVAIGIGGAARRDQDPRQVDRTVRPLDDRLASTRERKRHLALGSEERDGLRGRLRCDLQVVEKPQNLKHRVVQKPRHWARTHVPARRFERRFDEGREPILHFEVDLVLRNGEKEDSESVASDVGGQNFTDRSSRYRPASLGSRGGHGGMPDRHGIRHRLTTNRRWVRQRGPSFLRCLLRSLDGIGLAATVVFGS
jgi:hypothetical protein